MTEAQSLRDVVLELNSFLGSIMNDTTISTDCRQMYRNAHFELRYILDCHGSSLDKLREGE